MVLVNWYSDRRCTEPACGIDIGREVYPVDMELGILLVAHLWLLYFTFLHNASTGLSPRRVTSREVLYLGSDTQGEGMYPHIPEALPVIHGVSGFRGKTTSTRQCSRTLRIDQ